MEREHHPAANDGVRICDHHASGRRRHDGAAHGGAPPGSLRRVSLGRAEAGACEPAASTLPDRRGRCPRGILPGMPTTPPDPLLLGQRVVAILETGLRTATYKLATLRVLIDYALEHLPDDTNESLEVPLSDLAHRVLELYWAQVRPFDGRQLRQSTQPRARVPQAALDLRAAAGVGTSRTSLAVAAARAPAAYRDAIDAVVLCLAQQPLYRLQRLPGAPASDCFLYDDSFLHDHITRATLRGH